jgi:hypothetical protein
MVTYSHDRELFILLEESGMYNQEEKVDALGRVIPDVNSLAANFNAAPGTGVSQVDAKAGQTHETEDQVLATLTKRYEEAVATIGNIDRKALDGLPSSSRSVTALTQAVAEVEKIRDKMEADRNMQVAGKFVDGLLIGSMAGAVGASAAGDKGMLAAGSGVYSPEELEKRKNPIEFNKELEKILKDGGIDKKKLALTGITTDGKDVDMVNPLVVDKSLPNKAVELVQGKSGFERSLSA